MQKFTGRQYLKIDIANSFGLDKETWDDRIKWFDYNWLNLRQLQNQAEDPALFYAGILAYDAVLRGEAIGYTISLDATSSGLQILAALTGDRKAAELCNVVPTGKREDAYTAVFEHMKQALSESEEKAGSVKRKDCKQAVMTALYGSKAQPKKAFGEGLQLQTFYHVMEEQAPDAWKLNEDFLTMWDPETLVNEWVLPDNFHVRVKVMGAVKETVHFLNEPYEIIRQVNMPAENGRSLGANTIHSIDGMIVREMVRRCNYNPERVAEVRMLFDCPLDPFQNAKTDNDKMVKILWNHYKKSGYLSARILDHLQFCNAGHVEKDVIYDLIDSLPKKPFQIISIHDCFRCLPTYGNDLREQYTRQLYLIAKSDLLNFLLSQIQKRPIDRKKGDPSLAEDILNAEYALS